MFGRLPKTALFGSLLVLGLGCSHARLVELSPNGGGVIAIPDNTNSWPSRNRRHAEELMAQRCPNGYVVETEREVVIGQVAHTNTETEQHNVPVLTSLGLAPAKLETQQTTSYVDQKEWRIWFRPKDTPPSADQSSSLTPERVYSGIQ
jgi:hypothetical protein